MTPAYYTLKDGREIVCTDSYFTTCRCELCQERDREQPRLRKLTGVAADGRPYRVRVPA